MAFDFKGAGGNANEKRETEKFYHIMCSKPLSLKLIHLFPNPVGLPPTLNASLYIPP